MEVVPRYQPELEVSEHQQQYGLNADVPQQWHDPKAQETDLGQFLSPLNQSQGSTGKKGWVPVVAIAVALTAAIVGAAIGAGLGASLSKCQNNLGYVWKRLIL
jgi:hypothetical protein